MEVLSKKFYLGAVVIPSLYATVSVIILFRGMIEKANEDAFFLIHVAIPTLFVEAVLLVLYYKMWASIQKGGLARTSPGKAVGLLFVPIYNLYWFFQVIFGFAQDYNNFINTYSIKVPKLSKGLFLLYTIFAILAITPLAIFFFIPWWLVGLIIISRICNAVNALPESFDVNQTIEPLITALMNEWAPGNKIAKKLVKIGRPAIEPLVVALKNEHSNVRFNAAWVLGEISDIRAVDPLIENLKNDSLSDKRSADKALMKITGQNFNEDITKWQEWREKNKESLLRSR